MIKSGLRAKMPTQCAAKRRHIRKVLNNERPLTPANAEGGRPPRSARVARRATSQPARRATLPRRAKAHCRRAQTPFVFGREEFEQVTERIMHDMDWHEAKKVKKAFGVRLRPRSRMHHTIYRRAPPSLPARSQHAAQTFCP